MTPLPSSPSRRDDVGEMMLDEMDRLPRLVVKHKHAVHILQGLVWLIHEREGDLVAPGEPCPIDAFDPLGSRTIQTA